MFRNSIIKIFKRFVVKVCWKLIQWTGEKPTFNSNKLPDLCPTDNAENCEEYIDRLNELLINREIVKEIAITAPYSGGKSSFINTYKRLNPQYEYTCISLGAFSDEEVITGGSGDHGVLNINKIEKSIVQQILYKTNSHDMPNSRFRKIIKSSPSNLNALMKSIVLMPFTIAVAMITYIPQYTLEAQHIAFLKNGFIWGVNWGVNIIVLLGGVFLLQRVFKILPRFNLSKFNPIKGEIAFEEQKHDSVFNIYLEEIVYYFSKTKSGVVFFEDLDRFKCPEIFVQLKELNKLINDSADVEQSVRFIYALKDDVFKGGNRTKFFDAIIPIIPITNKSNSFPLLKKLLKESGFESEFQNNYLRDIAVFIDDMRMLKNVVAEYGIYKPILQKNLKIDLQKLFSFIIYKNIYSHDFAKLHSGEGDLAAFFVNLHNLRSNLKDEIKDKIKELELSLVSSDAEHLQNLNELNAAYLLIAINNSENADLQTINGDSIAQLSEPEIFKKLLSPNNLRATVARGHFVNINISALVAKIAPPYEIRKRNIENKDDLYKCKTKSEIKILQTELSLISHLSITNLIQKAGRSTVFKDIIGDKLLMHLLEKDYIDEQYHLYISVFYDGNISKTDMDYVLAVKNGETPEPSKPLADCVEILKYFSDEEFSKFAFFNYKMFDHLLFNGEEVVLIKFIESILKKQEHNIKMLYDVSQNVFEYRAWCSILINNWSDIWLSIIAYKSITTEMKNKLLIDFLLCVDELSLESNNINIIKNYIDENDSIIHSIPSDKSSIQRLEKLFVYLRIKFQQLSGYVDGVDFIGFIDVIINKELVEINPVNLLTLLNSLSDGERLDKFRLFDVVKLNNLDFDKLIEKNIIVISNFIISDEIEIGDKSSYLELLKNSNLSNEIKSSIINKEDFSIESLNEINDEVTLWPIFFEHNKIKATWGNISKFINSSNFDETSMIMFLNFELNSSNLLSQKYDLTEYTKSKLLSVLTNEDIIISTFEMLQVFVASLFETISYKDISKTKLNSIISHGYLTVNVENYLELKNIDLELSTLLLGKDFNVFLESIDDEESTYGWDSIEFDNEELLKLLTSQLLSVDHKNIIIKKIQQELIKPSIELVNLIVCILNQSISKHQIDKGLLSSLLTKCNIKEAKVDIYIQQVKYLDTDNQKVFLSLLGPEYDGIISMKSNTTIPHTTYNWGLLEALVELGLISSFSPTALNKSLKVNAKRRK